MLGFGVASISVNEIEMYIHDALNQHTSDTSTEGIHIMYGERYISRILIIIEKSESVQLVQDGWPLVLHSSPDCLAGKALICMHLRSTKQTPDHTDASNNQVVRRPACRVHTAVVSTRHLLICSSAHRQRKQKSHAFHPNANRNKPSNPKNPNMPLASSVSSA